MSNDYNYLSDMQRNCKLYTMVEIDKLKALWKARKFAIQVPDSIVQSGLLPSIFDWSLLGQLMPAEQACAELILQQRINDLELLNNLTTSLQRIQIQPEIGLKVDVIMGRPSYNVLVQDDGSILVKELPSLHIHVYETDDQRPAAGQDGDMLMLEQATSKKDFSGSNRDGPPAESIDDLAQSPEVSNQGQVAFGESPNRTCILNNNRSKMDDRVQHCPKPDDHTKRATSMELEMEVPPPSEANVHQTEEPSTHGIRLRRRQPFWTRFSNWLCHKFHQ